MTKQNYSTFISGLGVIIVLLFQALPLLGQGTAPNFWSEMNETAFQETSNERWITPDRYRAVQLDMASLRAYVISDDAQLASGNGLAIRIPLPDGDFETFLIRESSIMEKPLADAYPSIRTFKGEGMDDSTSKIFLDITPQGFHAMVLSTGGSFFIDPYFKSNDRFYVSYFKEDFTPVESFRWSCGFQPGEKSDVPVDRTSQHKGHEIRHKRAAITMRTYRIAIAATGEYTTFHGGTVTSGLAAINTALNRVRGVYETELAISFSIVGSNNQIVYTDPATDPYTNGNSSALLTENQTNLDNVIGTANYDVGHVFETGGGGLAGLGVICNEFSKAQGETGSGQPTGDPFWIDFVAHELGHQFAGNHTFNGSAGNCSGGNRNGSTAYEPGSGSTIQAYAGICSPQNLQNNSDPYFHLISLMEMRAHVTSGSGAGCGTPSGTNNTPDANANAENINNKSIPTGTPFELTGSATDADGDELTYNWEQWDLGAQGNIDPTSTDAPIFRSFSPTTSATRIFPKLSDILSNSTTYGEVLPTVARQLKFQFIARDDNNESGYGNDMITLNVVSTPTPFRITSPNTTTSLSGSTTVTWDVANTNVAPISCSLVDIYLSIDGGQTFTTQLANDVSNSGSATVTLPNINTTTARLKVKCADNVFFDINDANFTITPSGGGSCTITSITAGSQGACDPGTNTYTRAVIVTFTDAPGSGSLDVNGQTFAMGMSPQTVTLTGLTADGNAVDVTAKFTSDMTCTRTEASLFTAPASCAPSCSITSITAGSQGTCDPGTNTYTQAVTVTFANPPGSGSLDVNGQTFTTGTSPRTVTLTGLTADGNAVNVTAKFTADMTCTRTEASLFTAPASCSSSSCTTVASTDVPKTIIEPTAGTVTSTLVFTNNVTITDVNLLNLTGTHTYIGDLVISLTSPNGTTVVLKNSDPDCGESDFNLNFDDAAANALGCTTTSGETFMPANMLSAFHGENAMGTWTLTVEDVFDGDGGQLNSWSLEICSQAIPSCSITSITAGSQGACDPGTNTYTQAVTVTFANPPGSGSLDVNGQTFSIGMSPQTVTLTGLTADGNAVDVTAKFTSDMTCTRTEASLFTAPASCTPSCTITSIAAGSQGACDPGTNTYTQAVIVTFANPPGSGSLDVNGQTFSIGMSPQTVTLTGLTADGNAVDVTAKFTSDMTCTRTEASLFTAPTDCTPSCTITSITAGSQGACDPGTNTYTQAVTVTFANPPGSGSLDVNGQTFSIGMSPQTVALTGLTADGSAVNVTAKFTSDMTCTRTEASLFTAPASCTSSSCTTVASTDVPKTIMESTAGTVTSTLAFTNNVTITDVNLLNLTGTHTYIGDLVISLTSPNGTTVVLKNSDPDCGESDFNLNFDDAAANALGCTTTSGETFMPVNMLSAFNGENAMGTWTLTVEDVFDGDGGQLNSWSLEVCSSPINNCNNHVVNQNPIPDGTYQSDNVLSSNGTIPANGNVIFKATNGIELQSDFSVIQSAVFQATIEDCSN